MLFAEAPNANGGLGEFRVDIRELEHNFMFSLALTRDINGYDLRQSLQ